MNTRIHPNQTARIAQIHLIGPDLNGGHKAKIFAATRILRRHGVCINALRTTTFRGAMTGQPMFATDVDVVLPCELDAVALGNTLAQIADGITVDIEADTNVTLCGNT